MRLRTTNKRLRRNRWKRRGHTHIWINRGVWLRREIVDPTGEWPEAQQTIDGSYQPNSYTYYP